MQQVSEAQRLFDVGEVPAPPKISSVLVGRRSWAASVWAMGITMSRSRSAGDIDGSARPMRRPRFISQRGVNVEAMRSASSAPGSVAARSAKDTP